MSFKSLLKDKVDIYYLKEREWNYGYGIESTDSKDKQYYYDDTPDRKDVLCYCYFVSGSNNTTITKNDENNKILEVLKIHFLSNEDIRINSKILFDDEFYILQKPRKIRNHHIEVIAIREEYI